MQHDAIARHIEAATPEQLKAVARLALKLSGYPASRITDGPYDGGCDIVVENALGGVLPLAVAVSVERDWRTKLRKDVETVHRKLGVEHVLFISSRRIPEGSFRPVQTQLRDGNMHVDRLDQQGIADLVMDKGALGELLEALDIRADALRVPNSPRDRQRDVAYAYAFFAPEVHEFRKAVRARTLLMALAQVGGSARIEELCLDAGRLLGMNADDATGLRSDIDRLRAQGSIQGRNGEVMLAPDQRATIEALWMLRQHQEAGLRDQLRAEVEKAGIEPLDDVLQLLMHGVGALVARHIDGSQTLEDLHAQARRLRRELQAYGLSEGDQGDQFVVRAIEVARSSELGQSLATGSVYQALMRLDREALLRALDAKSIACVLDASVAMPMLSALLHGSVEQRFFVVAEDLHRRSERANISLQLPEVWLEEMASHLLNAREYLALVSDDDLRQSRNAYVAYFTAARHLGRPGDFSTFLAEFGLTEALGRRAGVDPKGARRELEVFLRRQLDHYGIMVVSTSSDRRYRDRAAQDWAWACHDLAVEDRPQILADHDTQVLAWLAATTEQDPTHAPLIITWDRVLRRARPERAPGGALDPLAMVELLSFVAGTREPAMTARFLSLQLTEAEAERGAGVLDALVRLEHGRLSDAALVRKAQEFKQAYLRERDHQPSVAALERAWRDFKTSA